jgi:hypothetical protein
MRKMKVRVNSIQIDMIELIRLEGMDNQSKIREVVLDSRTQLFKDFQARLMKTNEYISKVRTNNIQLEKNVLDSVKNESVPMNGKMLK